MKKYPTILLIAAALLLMGLVPLAVACGGSDDIAGATESTTAEVVGGIEVKGLLDDPATLDVAALEAMTVVDLTVEHPKLGTTDYRGVLISELLTELGLQEGATTVTMAASDGYMVEIPLAELQACTDAILALEDDGTVTVIIPDMASKNWVKDVAMIEFK